MFLWGQAFSLPPGFCPAPRSVWGTPVDRDQTGRSPGKNRFLFLMGRAGRKPGGRAEALTPRDQRG